VSIEPIVKNDALLNRRLKNSDLRRVLGPDDRFSSLAVVDMLAQLKGTLDHVSGI
jgi:hypothetical protein